VNGTEAEAIHENVEEIEKIGEEKSESENFTKFRMRETQRDKKCRTDKACSKRYSDDLNLRSASLFVTYKAEGGPHTCSIKKEESNTFNDRRI